MHEHSMETEPTPTFLTTHDAAVIISVSPKTIRRWIKAGRLKGYRVGRHYRVRRDELLAAMDPEPRRIPVPRAPTLPATIRRPPTAS